MRGFVVPGLAVALVFSFAEGADARGGRGGLRFTRTSPTVGAPAKPAPRPGSLVFIGTGAMGSRAAARPADSGAAAGPARPLYREAPPSAVTAAAQPHAETEAPKRPWCDDGKVLGGLCVLN